MRFRGHRSLKALLLVATTSFISVPAALADDMVKVDGSSTVFPVTEAVAEEFQIQMRGKIKVTVGISGTGGGFKKFCRGEIDVQDASRPILKEEIAACKANKIQFIELPIAFDAITIVVSPTNKWANDITVAELKKLWEPAAKGKVMKWKDVRASWPDEPIKLYGAGPDSGTFDYFTEAVVGKAKASRSDYTGSEDDNILVQGISHDKNALGYLPFAYYEANSKKLKALGVKIDAKKPAVTPTAASVEGGTYRPLSRPIFIYLSSSSLKRPEVSKFADFYVDNVGALAGQVKYVPLPKAAYDLVKTNLKTKKFGTVFDGTQMVGIKIEELLKRETSH